MYIWANTWKIVLTTIVAGSWLPHLPKHPTLHETKETSATLERMRSQDEKLLQAGSLELEILSETRHDGDWNRPFGTDYLDQTSVSNVRLTYDTSRLAGINCLHDLCYANPDRVTYYLTPDEDGDRRLRSLPIRIFMVRDAQIQADYEEYAFLYFGETGCIAKRKTDRERLNLYPSYESGYITIWLETAVLCLGRGYTFGIEQVESFTERSDGLWELRGRGPYPLLPILHGKNRKPEWRRDEWRLVVEPETLIVREAYWGGRLICRTEGTRFYGTIAVAARGYYYEFEEFFRLTVAFQRTEPRFDINLYSICLERATNPADGTSVYDRRGDKVISFQYKKKPSDAQ